MKKLKNLWLVILAITLLFSQCSTPKHDTLLSIKGNEILNEEIRKISGYESIILKGSFDVILTDNPQKEIRIQGEENIIPLVQTKLNGKTLELYFDSKKSIQYKKLVVYVPAQGVNNLELMGSGDIKNEGVLKSQTFDINLIGSGDIDLNNLTTEKTVVSLKGSGDVFLQGNSEILTANLEGSGDISAYEFIANEVNAVVKGSGDVEVYTKKSFVGQVDGSGDIKVKGKPANVSKSTKGSGNIHIL